MNYALIMAGGAGTRLWPLSRERLPKPALSLYSHETMFQIAVNRLDPLFSPSQVMVISGAGHVAVLAEQVSEIPKDNFLTEPEGRGTAPAIALAAVHLSHRDPNASMAVLTADHHIGNTAIFRRAISAALEMAKDDYLVTLGIRPTHPSIEYGYIQQTHLIGERGGFSIFNAERFIEKPHIERAEEMLSEGGYSWNSGMFIWKVDTILEQFQTWMPDLYDKIMRIGITIGTPEYDTTLQEIWPTIQKETIDYGIMEQAKRVAVIPVDMEWLDIGNWNSLKSLLNGDSNNNSFKGDVLLVDCNETLVLGEKRLIAAVGLEDMIIVDTPDALLVCRKDHVQDVRKLVAMLKEKGREDLT